MYEGTPKHPNILVVEDDHDQRELLCEALRMHYADLDGCNVVATTCAAEALDQDLESFDVILQDHNLPDMNGLELIDKILARADVPIIMVTGENVFETAAEAIRRGAQDYVVKFGDYLFALPLLVDKNIRLHGLKLENKRLQLDLEAMLAELQVRNVQLTESLGKLDVMARTDPLTELSNRRHFAEVLERLYAEAVRYRFDLTCCMCDLDRYKGINDSLGHQVGDEVLIIAAEIIRGSLRASDIAARYGGDEFVLLLPHTSLERGHAVVDRIRRELSDRTARHPTIARPVTLSIGICSLATDGADSPDALVSMADRALYAAKEGGRDKIVLFNSMSQSAPAC